MQSNRTHDRKEKNTREVTFQPNETPLQRTVSRSFELYLTLRLNCC
jgi:hypothetical protein